MRQIFYAFQMYVNDNKGFLPAMPGQTCTIGSTKYPMGWWMLGSGMMDLSDGAMIPYLPPTIDSRLRIFNCPDDEAQGDFRLINGLNTLGLRNFTFSFNAYINYTANTSPHYDDYYVWSASNPKHASTNMARIRSSASKILICEEKWPNDSSCQIIGVNGGTPSAQDVPSDRHSGYGNYCFCDGHVDRATPDDVYNNCTHAAQPALNLAAGTAIGTDWWNWFKD
jgi:prepilin-type processing-associated H-X9-DG protein